MKFGIPNMKLSKDINLLLASIFILHLGLYIVSPILPVILSSDKGLDTASTGIVIGAGALAIQAGSVIGGLLSDRMGRKSTMVIGAALEAVGLFGFGIVNSFISLLIFSIINGGGSGIYSPAVRAAIAALASESAETRTTAFSLRGIAANVGVSLAGLVIFLLSGVSSNVLFFIAAGIFVLLSVFSWILLPKDCDGDQCPRVPASSYLQIFKNKPFIVFSAVSMLTWIVYTLFSFLLPLRGEAVLKNVKLVGTIWTITSIVVIVAQGLISKYILQKINSLTAIFCGVLFIGGGIFLIGFANNFVSLTFAALVFLIGEMLMLPTTDSLTSELAQAELIGAYFSIASLITGLGTALGNFIGGEVINIYGITSFTPWTIFAISAVGVAFVVLVIRSLPVLRGERAKEKIQNG